MATSWGWVGLALILLQFLLPFLLLLSRDLKRSRKSMVFISALVFFMRYVDLYWSIKPEVFRTGIRITVPDLVLPVALGGIWLWSICSIWADTRSFRRTRRIWKERLRMAADAKLASRGEGATSPAVAYERADVSARGSLWSLPGRWPSRWARCSWSLLLSSD